MKAEKKRWHWLGLPVILAAYVLLKGGGQAPTQLALRLVLLCGGYAAMLSDLRTTRIPNKLVGVLAAAWLLILAPLVLYDADSSFAIGVSGLLGLAVAGSVMLVVYFVSRKGLGGGDVKLMSAAGLYLGYGGVLSALLYGSVLAAIAALILILTKKMTAKDAIPLVPFLYVGILLTEFIR